MVAVFQILTVEVWIDSLVTGDGENFEELHDL
jgi:hypothetical protein